jgi:hypothetical protein
VAAVVFLQQDKRRKVILLQALLQRTTETTLAHRLCADTVIISTSEEQEITQSLRIRRKITTDLLLQLGVGAVGGGQVGLQVTQAQRQRRARAVGHIGEATTGCAAHMCMKRATTKAQSQNRTQLQQGAVSGPLQLVIAQA